jgi:uncharacterized protein (UPF0297 family)
MNPEDPEHAQIEQKRKERSEKEQQLKKNVQEMLDPFYCKLCNKGYKRVSQWEEHLNSYDHAHKKVHEFVCHSDL